MASRNVLLTANVHVAYTMAILSTLVLGSRCPNELVDEVFGCLINMTGESSSVAADDIQAIKYYCTTESYMESVSCLDKLYSACPQVKDKVLLGILVDPVSIKTAFQIFCSKVEAYYNASTCIRSKKPYINECVDRKRKDFYQQVKGLQAERRIVNTYCNYIHAVRLCITVPIHDMCSKPAAYTFNKLMMDLSPPVCRQASNSAPASRSIMAVRNSSDGIIQSLLTLIHVQNSHFKNNSFVTYFYIILYAITWMFLT